MDDSTAATPVPSGQPFLAAPPKPQKIAIGAIFTGIKLGAEVALPITLSILEQVRGSDGSKYAAIFLAAKEQELARRGPDAEVEAALTDADVPIAVKYLIKSLVEQLMDARSTMKLGVEMIGGTKK